MPRKVSAHLSYLIFSSWRWSGHSSADHLASLRRLCGGHHLGGRACGNGNLVFALVLPLPLFALAVLAFLATLLVLALAPSARVGAGRRGQVEQVLGFSLGLRLRVEVAVLVPLHAGNGTQLVYCLLYTSPSPRDQVRSRMPSSA